MTDDSEVGRFRPHHVAKAAGWLIVGQALSLCLKLALVPVLTRLLNPAEFGVVTVSMAFILFITTLGGQGGWSAALVVIHRHNVAAWRSAYTFTLILASIMTVVVCAFAHPLAALIGMKGSVTFLRALAFLLPLVLGTEFLSTYLISSDRYRSDAKIGLLAEVLAAISAISGALAGLGAWALVIQQVVAYAIRFVLGTRASGLLPTMRPDFRLVWPLTPYAAKSTAAELVNFMGVQGPLILVGRALGAAGGGLYGVSNRITSLPGDILMQSLARILVPAFASLPSGEERAKAVVWSGTANSFATVPILFGAAAVAKPLCSIVLGPAFIGAAGVLAWLAIGKAIAAPCAGFYSYLKAANRMGLLWGLMSVRSVLLIVGTVLGIRFGGVTGAGVGYAIAMVPVLLLFCAVVFNHAEISWRKGMSSFALIVFGAAIMAALVYQASTYLLGLGWSNVASLISSVPIGVAIYAAFVFFAFREEITKLRGMRFLGGAK